MLAKLWKKVLLAVCIVACIFNIMTKLVSRNSLEVNLKSANDGNTVFDFTRKEKEEDEGPSFMEELHQVLNDEQNKTAAQNVVSQETSAEDSTTENQIQNETENSEVENEDNIIKAEVSGGNNNHTVEYKDAFTTFVELF